jgi:hypothetical protein
MTLRWWVQAAVGVALCVLLGGDTVTAKQATPEAGALGAGTPDAFSSLRGTPYCEILVPISGGDAGIQLIDVYNTLGLNDCPAEAWEAIDPATEAKKLGVPMIVKNGPRFLNYDRVTAESIGTPVAFGDLHFQLVAVLRWPTEASFAQWPFYSERQIERSTAYVFAAGKPVFQLVSPDGTVYVMQTYATEVNPTLTLDDLPALGDHLKLPEGWQYRVVTPDEDLTVTPQNGVARILRDELLNTYQFMGKA